MNGKNINVAALCITLGLLPLDTLALDSTCKSKREACDVLSDIQKNFIPMLPLKLSGNMTVTHVLINKLEVIKYVQLSYDLNFLKADMASKGATVDDAKNVMQRISQKYVCSTPELKKAVNAGIKFITNYKLGDGVNLTTTVVDKC